MTVCMVRKVAECVQRKSIYMMIWEVSGIFTAWCELVLGIGDFNGHVGKRIEGYEGVHRGNGIGGRKLMWKERCC